MLWPSRHLNTATKLGPPYWTLTKHAGSHAAQCGKVKVAILNPAPKSVPCHFQLAPGNVREQLRSSNLGYHNLCKAPNQPPISSFKIFTVLCIQLPLYVPLAMLLPYFMLNTNNHGQRRTASLRWTPSFFSCLSNPLA